MFRTLFPISLSLSSVHSCTFCISLAFFLRFFHLSSPSSKVDIYFLLHLKFRNFCFAPSLSLSLSLFGFRISQQRTKRNERMLKCTQSINQALYQFCEGHLRGSCWHIGATREMLQGLNLSLNFSRT